MAVPGRSARTGPGRHVPVQVQSPLHGYRPTPIHQKSGFRPQSRYASAKALSFSFVASVIGVMPVGPEAHGMSHALPLVGAMAIAVVGGGTAHGAGMLLIAPDEVATGEAPQASVEVTNDTDEPMALTVAYSLQRDRGLDDTALPDPIHGSNHAPGLRSWLEVDGEIVEDGGSTDGRAWTAAGTEYGRDHYLEAFQMVELDRAREIRRMTWQSGDANHSWFVDVFASEDGREFAPVAGLVDVDHYQKWGLNEFPLAGPFTAKVLRFRYHTGGTKQSVIRFPSELGIYDGTADEAIELPKVGPAIDRGQVRLTVAPRSAATAALPLSEPLTAGAYLLAAEAKGGGVHLLAKRHLFGALAADAGLLGPGSRIGLNASSPELAPKLAELGVGWVRFENMKWPFVSDTPHEYSFTGTVPPWELNIDRIFRAYRDNGLNVLSYMFLVPEWASEPPDAAPENMRLCFPPKDPSLYGEFCFQVAARYGTKEHPPQALLTEDKQSGLGLVRYFEMYNEPNLNPRADATWGGWAGPLDAYYEMMRYGAEGVKRADPDAIVTSAGYAGMKADVVDELRTHVYADGKRALDFVDVINVHYYSGHEPPETATTDGNANPTGEFTLAENLRELAQWRHEHAPGKPIWMTETGYDSAGPFGTTEAIQAARLPRVVMLCLANGVDKVLVYRESGSTPSRHAASGVVRNDHTPKPSWYSFGTLVRQFRGVVGGAVRLPHPDPNVWLMEWDDGGEPLLTAWTVNGDATMGLELGPCTAIDAFGGRTELGTTANLVVNPYPRYLRGVDAEALDALRAERRRLDAELAARRERIRGLQKYLYDFGSMENVGTFVMEGTKTPFVPVVKTDLWADGAGYGFAQPPLGDDDRQWLANDALNRDSTRVRDHLFRFAIEPGQYRLMIRIEPFDDAAEVLVTGADDSPLTLRVTKREPTASADITVREGGSIAVQVADDYANLCWISCVEKLIQAR